MTPTPVANERRLNAFLIVLFCAALAAHFHFATMNWHYQFMAGHEFRQAQTALISYYIDKENNFSVDYSVPILGKPWVLPLEFPLYEWGVVWLSRATHLPQFEAARTISLACFYLTLPALYLLFGQLGLSRPRRLLALACTLVCPVYIFYARAVLVDPMALLCSVWFLAAFVRTMQTRRWRWFVLCTLCGAAAGVIKSLVWFVWVVPAAAYGAWCLWRAHRAPTGSKNLLRTAAWGLGVMILPVAASLTWARYTDAAKINHSSAYIFTSHNLAHYNYGTFSLATRVSGEVWQTLFLRWQESILPAWVLGLIVLPGIAFLRSVRWHIAGAAALFIVAQQLIPLAYAYQDYYFYACAAFATAAIAFTCHGLLDSRLPRWLALPLLLLPLVALFVNYRTTALRPAPSGFSYYSDQAVRSPGGSGLTESLKALTPPKSVIIVAGADWSPVIPYYTQRKALMIRRGLENDYPYLERALQDLAGEDISALVLVGDQRGNQDLRRFLAARLDLDPAVTYSHSTADVYVNKLYRDAIVIRLNQHHGYHEITTTAKPPAIKTANDGPTPISPPTARTMFDMVSPAPVQMWANFAFDVVDFEGARALFAHPDSNLWVPAPPTARRIVCEFAILPGAYQGDNGRTNGVEFIVDAETPEGGLRTLFHRVLDPAAVETDRGLQHADIPFVPQSGETLVFRTRPNGHRAFDWAVWRHIEVN